MTTTSAPEFTVTRTERNGRYAYAVNGTPIRNSSKAFRYAIVDTGNPSHPTGYYFELRMDRAAAIKQAESWRRMDGRNLTPTVVPVTAA